MAEPAAPVERACDRCRDRRVKCDKRHPACFRCEKLGKPCPGYEKKRKFVDEGITLRKKYDNEGNERSNTGDLAELSLHSPTSTLAGNNHGSPSSIDAKRRALSLSHVNLTKTHQPPRNSYPTGSDFIQPSLPEFEYAPTTVLNQVPPVPSDMDIDSILNEVLDTSQFDPDWFNLEPASFYGKNNNSCGFIPNLPNIVDEVDNGLIRPSTEVFDTAMSGFGNVNDPNGWSSESQLHTSHIITDEREHEMAFLVRHFVESIGPWMDLFDCENHFGQRVPLKALKDALLKNAVAAVAAKQLGRMRGRKLAFGGQHQRPAAMEVMEGDTKIDWYYKAANYYDKAIMYSRFYLEALSGQMRSPSSPGNRAAETVAKSDDLLLAVSIFSLYESLDNVEAGWLQHLTGMRTLLTVLSPIYPDSEISLSVTIGRRASFWNFARADYQASYIHKRTTLIDTDDFSFWRSCGLQISPAGNLYDDPAKIERDDGHRSDKVGIVAHTLLWILLRTMNYVASAHQSNASQQASWQVLTSQLQAWHDCLPTAFQPCAQLRHSLFRRRAKQDSIDEPSRISEIFFSIPLCAATMQLYHFACIVLLLNPPQRSNLSGDSNSSPAEAIDHAYEIVGIALARPRPSVRVEMLLPLYAAGLCITVPEDRRVVLEILEAIELDTGCTTEGRIRELTKHWGWDSGQSYPGGLTM